MLPPPTCSTLKTCERPAGEWDGYEWFTDNSDGPGTPYDLGDPIPKFTGWINFDSTNLYLAFDVERSGKLDNHQVSVDVPASGVFDDPDSFYAVWPQGDANPTFREYYDTGTDYPWDRNNRSSTWGNNVIAARTDPGDGHHYFEWQIPLASIGASWGDTIGLKIMARDYINSGHSVNTYPDFPAGVTYAFPDSRLEVSGNYEDVTLVPEPVTMAGLVLGIGALGGYVRRRRNA